jgi:hypothetical protein
MVMMMMMMVMMMVAMMMFIRQFMFRLGLGERAARAEHLGRQPLQGRGGQPQRHQGAASPDDPPPVHDTPHVSTCRFVDSRHQHHQFTSSLLAWSYTPRSSPFLTRDSQETIEKVFTRLRERRADPSSVMQVDVLCATVNDYDRLQVCGCGGGGGHVQEH